MKRKDYITWDEYFMGIAMLAAKRSKDPNTQGAATMFSPGRGKVKKPNTPMWFMQS